MPDRRIAILEDDAALRADLVRTINAGEGLRVVADAETVTEALAALSPAGADLWLVDLNLPDGNGIEFIQDMRKTSDAKSLILTVLGDRESVLAALKAGADGYLLKDTPASQLCRHIAATLDGQTPISPKAATFLLQMLHDEGGPAPFGTEDLPKLSDREIEVLRLFSRGLSYREAADVLGLSPHTIGDHVKSIYRRLCVNSRAEALFEARQLGLIGRGD
jgi:DNA-binding NarL/FixJ family response regulator